MSETAEGQMKVAVNWQSGSCSQGVSGSGHSVLMDGPADHGGRDQGARPMEMLLMGLGGCALYDVVNILRKGRQTFNDCRLEIIAQRADEVPAVFKHVRMVFYVDGVDLSEQLIKRAVALSAEKYCSASIMLKRAGVDFDYEIIVNDQRE